MDPEKQFAMFSGLDLICCVMFNKDIAENEYGSSFEDYIPDEPTFDDSIHASLYSRELQEIESQIEHIPYSHAKSELLRIKNITYKQL